LTAIQKGLAEDIRHGLEVCVARLADSLEPPPRQTVSEWADQDRRLSSEASAEQGEWRTDRAPYQRAIMDALSPYSPHERVVVMSSSQIGKTELLNNFVAYSEAPTLEKVNELGEFKSGTI
jgi:phage terminase large subunit GpA-like protein